MTPKRKVTDVDDPFCITFTKEDGADPDLTIICHPNTFRVHESILAPKCKFIEKALKIDMKEKKERAISLETRESYVVKAVIFFAYRGDYHDQSGNDPDHKDNAATCNAKVYALGEELQMPSIKPLAIEKLRAILDQSLKLADFFLSVKAIYETTPSSDRGLRDVVSKLTIKTVEDVKVEPGFRRAMDEVPGFAHDLLLQTLATYPRPDTFTCPNPKCKLIVSVMLDATFTTMRCWKCGAHQELKPKAYTGASFTVLETLSSRLGAKIEAIRHVLSHSSWWIVTRLQPCLLAC